MADLLRARAGMSLPERTHQGFEECFVLEGESPWAVSPRTRRFPRRAGGTVRPPSSTKTGVTVYLRSAIGSYPGMRRRQRHVIS